MNAIQTYIPETVLTSYKENSLQVSSFLIEPEGENYKASNFTINSKKCIYRTAKTTPKKTGHFVTFWKRNANGITAPFHTNDVFDFYVVTVRSKNKYTLRQAQGTLFSYKIGQFIFPKSVLLQKNIISTNQKEGKRGFRVYPSWDIPKNKQAKNTQKWQLNYFFDMDTTPNIKEIFN